MAYSSQLHDFNPAEQLLTTPGDYFSTHHQRLWGFLLFLSNLISSNELMDARVAAHETQLIAPVPRVPRVIRYGGKYQKEFTKYFRTVLDMALNRATDNFLTYVSELLALVFITRPETLRSSETIKLEEILEHRTMDELIGALAERKVERLPYQGMKALAQDLNTRLHFCLFEDESDLKRAIYIIECRNLIVHNRGVVNETFRRKTGDSTLKSGSSLALKAADVFGDVEFLAKSVLDIDRRAAEKFGLERLSRFRKIVHSY